MFTEEVRKRVIDILKLTSEKSKKELHKLKETFIDDEDMQLLIDAYIFSFSENKKKTEISQWISKIENYKESVLDEVLFLNILAWMSLTQENYEKAEKYYNLVIKKDESNAAAYFNLGILYKEIKEYEKAVEYYKLAIEKNKSYTSAYNNLGVLYKELQDYEKAEEYYKLAIETDENNPSPYFNLGVLYKELQDYEKAEEYYKLAIETDENNASPYFNLGVLYKELQDYEKAEEYYKLAIEKNEKYASANNNLGVLYKNQKEYEKAEKYYKRAIEINKDYSLAYRNLGKLYKLQDKSEESEKMFRLAKEISEKEDSKLETSLIDLEIEKLESIKVRELKDDGELKSDFIKKTSHLFESIDERKREFNKFITDNRSNEKLLKLEVLRRWNSYTPIIANNFHVSKGGGYFLNLNGHGCVIDPGFNFIDNFKGSGKCFRMIDSVIISHAHNDHESDLESILTLLYKYNEEVKCLDFHDTNDDEFDESKFEDTIRYDIAARDNKSIKDVSKADIEKEFLVSPRRKVIDIYIPESVYKKYQGMLDLYENNNYRFIQIKKDQSKTINGFEINFIWAKHRDIISSEHSLGLYLVHENNALVYTGDTGWSAEVADYYKSIKAKIGDKGIILIAHLGGFKDKEENFIYKNSVEEDCTYGNHLGRLGLVGINEVLAPKLCIVSEFGEEFKGSRMKICEILNDLFKTTYFLPADIGLNYNFGSDTIKAISEMDIRRDIIEEGHYKEVPYDEVSTVLLRADYSLHYYHQKNFAITDDLTQVLTKMYYTSPR